MSIELMNHVWKHADVTGSELLVLLVLADYSNEQGVCWPSLNTIGQKARKWLRKPPAQLTMLVLRQEGACTR